MQNDENWQAAIDWTEFDPVGGIRFYNFIKNECDAALRFGIGELEKIKTERESRIRRWDELAKTFARLDENFTALRGMPDFVEMVKEVDGKALLLFPADKFITIERWVKWGEFLTRSLKNVAHVSLNARAELAEIARDLANATALKNFFAAYVSASEKDFILRRAPIRYRTKIFRDVTKDIATLVSVGSQLNMATAPEFMRRMTDEVEKIKSLAHRTAKTCRLAKKAIERSGESFWRDFSAWDEIRLKAN